MSKMANKHTDALKHFGIRFSDEATEANKQLLAKIDSESISRASLIKGSIYFYSNILGDANPSKEELIDDSSVLDVAIETLGIEIRYENKHHRWGAQLPHALKILEFAAMYLSRHNNASPDNIGINAELKWRDDQGLENIVHLTQDRDSVAWQVTRYA